MFNRTIEEERPIIEIISAMIRQSNQARAEEQRKQHEAAAAKEAEIDEAINEWTKRY